MDEWRAGWQVRDARLRLRLLTAELDQIRGLKPSLERLLLITEAEELIANAGGGSVIIELESKIQSLRDLIEDESVRSLLDDME